MTLKRLHRALAGALVVLAPLAPALAAERSLSLEEAVVLALEKNEQIVVGREVVVSAAAAQDGARGAYDPLLTVESAWRQATEPVNSAFSGAPEGEPAPTDETTEATASLQRLLPTGGAISLRAGAARRETDGAFALLSPAYGTQVGVELRQPLLRDRAIDAARLTIRVAAADRSRADASLGEVVNETVAAVEEAYWALTSARLAVDVQEDAVRLAEAQLEQTQIRIDGGAAPETEIAQPRAELERRRGELFAARETMARAENALKLLVLADADEALWTERLVPAEEAAVEVEPVEVAAALARALASRPELYAATAAVERRRAETAFARDGVRPVLDAVVSYDRYGLAGSANPDGGSVPGLPTEVPPGLDGGLGQSFDTLGDGDFDDTRVALVLGIPLGNRAARAAAAAAASAERQAEAELARLRKAVRVEVLDAAAALETAGQRIEAARSAREAAEVQLAAEQERYSVGLSTNFLVLTRQNDLSRARLDEIAALTDYRTARVEMGRATGSLLADRGIELASAAGGSPAATPTPSSSYTLK